MKHFDNKISYVLTNTVSVRSNFQLWLDQPSCSLASPV